MKKLLSFVAIVMIAGFSTNMNAQNDASATATATATIIAPITINKTIDMNFGWIIKGDAVVTLDTADGRTSTNADSFAGTQTGTFKSAHFTVTGETDYLFDTTLPTTHTIKNGVNSMTVSNFTSSLDTDDQVLTSGSIQLVVGADLAVAASQASGVYTSETDVPFTVTVNYN